MTPVLPLDEGVAEAVAALRRGELVVHPTETVYGVGCALGAGEGGLRRLRYAKGIGEPRPFLLVASDLEAALDLWDPPPLGARALAERCWPGPLSLVGPARRGLPVTLLGGGQPPSIGVRVPAHPGLLRLLRALGEPMISTSANRSGCPPSRALPRDALGAALILDGGRCPGGRPSTVVSLMGAAPRVLRAGAAPWPLSGDDPR